MPELDDLLPAPDTDPVVLSARTPIATIIAIGLLLIGGLLLGGALATAAFAQDLPTEARVAALTAVTTAAAGAVGGAGALLARVRG